MICTVCVNHGGHKLLNYSMRTSSNIISETNSNRSLDDHIMIPLHFFFNHNIAVKIDFFHLTIVKEKVPAD